MAVRPQHMHDGGIVERRLRPIYGKTLAKIMSYFLNNLPWSANF